jgi:glycosyltransferase involved in cell wall biosynthesis
MTAPLITVLINTHNYGHFIEEAIDSVLSQDFPLDQLEILVVDDGSTDDTPERVKKYGSHIRYFYKPNGGQASALNYGIQRARGEIVALLDADDLFLPGKLARVIEAFQQNPALGMVYHPLLEWNLQTNERRDRGLPLVSGDIRTAPDQFFFYVPHPTSCISLRRTSLKPLLPIPEDIRMLADCYLVQLIPLLSPIFAIPEPLVLYRIHAANNCYADERQISLETRKIRQQERQILFGAMGKWLANNGYSYWKKQPPVRFFIDRWYLYQQMEGFLIKPPGRLRFFWFVVRENSAYSPRQTWKLTAIHYVTAFSALVFGYDNWRQMGEWRYRVVAKIARMFRLFFRSNDKVKV